MRKRSIVFAAALAIGSIGATTMGGWAIVTIESPPDYLLAGKPVAFTFVVRQHGMKRLGGLKPSIEASSRNRRISGSVGETSKEGEYWATLTAPDTGSWQIVINSGWGTSKGTMLPLRAVTSPSQV